MKLLSKTTRYYLFVSVPILLVVSIISFFMIKSEIRNGIDEYLQRELVKSKDLIRGKSFTTPFYLDADSLSKIQLAQGFDGKTGYSDTLIFDQLEQDKIAYRRVKELYTLNGRSYLITLYKPTLEEDELLDGLFLSFSIIIGLLVLILLGVNWTLSKTIWKPFYHTLGQLDTYEVKRHGERKLPTLEIDEFNKLNMSLNKLTEKVHRDYLQQKQFTENASHELQTPIAVVTTNLNLLIQSDKLGEVEMEQVQAIEKTIKKMAALNKTLLLLAKIENNQFPDHENVDIKEATVRSLNHVKELIIAKEIQLMQEYSQNVFVTANPALIDILISNLLQNAIRHNFDGGKINIVMSRKTLTISNTWVPLTIQPEELFIRFKKSDAAKESLGLGLSIVKGITDLYGYDISYNYEKGFHTFSVTFL